MMENSASFDANFSIRRLLGYCNPSSPQCLSLRSHVVQMAITEGLYTALVPTLLITQSKRSSPVSYKGGVPSECSHFILAALANETASDARSHLANPMAKAFAAAKNSQQSWPRNWN